LQRPLGGNMKKLRGSLLQEIKAHRLIRPGRLNWTNLEIAIAVSILKKFATCRQNGWIVPFAVFEAHAEGTKLVNSDVAIIDPRGRIYLIERGAKELWAGQLHLPGCTHAYETLKQATQRLLDNELKLFRLKLADLCHIGEPLEMQDLPRGPIQSNLFIARIERIPQGIKGRFYAAKEILWKRLVVSHRKVSLPWLINHHYLK
jgi:hypothetical protein